MCTFSIRFDLVKSQSRCEHLELQLTSTMSELTRRPLTSVEPEEKPQEDHVSRATSETKSISDGTSSDEVISVYVCIDPSDLYNVACTCVLTPDP